MQQLAIFLNILKASLKLIMFYDNQHSQKIAKEQNYRHPSIFIAKNCTVLINKKEYAIQSSPHPTKKVQHKFFI